MEKKFFDDLQKLYDLSHQQYVKRASWYRVLDGEFPARRQQIDAFLTSIDLEPTREHRLAILTRLIHLRTDALVQALKQAGHDQPHINRAKAEAYAWSARLHQDDHRALLEHVDEQKLLTPYYRAFLHGVHRTGLEFSHWHPQWTRHIIEIVNPSLEEEHGSEAVLWLREQGLLDPGHDGEEADRCYSALVKQGQQWHSLAYAEVFPTQIQRIVASLHQFMDELARNTDGVFGLELVHRHYLQALVDAFSERDTAQLVRRWAHVDRCWMADSGPLQIGHPLEYYEDHYRKAVAPEWDLRMINPALQEENHRQQQVQAMFDQLSQQLQAHGHPAIRASQENLRRTRLFLGRPLLYYGSDLEGLFSAQVVPNDEVISASCGKKIFAFADMVLEAQRSRPFMKIHRLVYGDDFEQRFRHYLFCQPGQWHQVYDALTVGHEYGHVLWMDAETETAMNRTGNFKNIEEFKATAGGLVTLFEQQADDTQLIARAVDDTIRRSVGLIAWMESDEVLPYYVEGLLHLHGLFASGILSFQGQQLRICTESATIGTLVSWYQDIYRRLARHYLAKQDAMEFLQEYVCREEKRLLPRQEQARRFVEYYWKLYQESGCVVDDEDHPDRWRALSQ